MFSIINTEFISKKSLKYDININALIRIIILNNKLIIRTQL